MPYQVVDITSPGYNAQLGRYFIGQTGEIYFGNGYDAWGGLINPVNSGVNLYFDIFTITNYSGISYTSEIWLNAKAPLYSKVSSTVTPSNQGITPPPKPKARIEFSDYITEPLRSGVNIFDRIVTSDSTLVSDSHQGSIILGPGSSFSILLKSPQGEEMIAGTIVLTWWEESLHSHGSSR
jgi:hypothetical protein